MHRRLASCLLAASRCSAAASTSEATAAAACSSSSSCRALSGFSLTVTPPARKQRLYDPSSVHPPTERHGPLTLKYPFPIEYYMTREVLVHNLDKQPVSVQSLDGRVFNVPVRIDILHRVVRYLRAMWQQGTHKAKTRGEVSGGGRKPWRQKKTGKARQGSIRSPLWRGGGAVFGPKPRSHAHHLYYKVRQLGLKCALSAKQHEGRLLLVDSLVPPSTKTRDVTLLLQHLLHGTGAKSALLVYCPEDAADDESRLRRGAGNLDWVHIMSVDQLTVYHILKYQALVLTTTAAQVLAKSLTDPHVRRAPPVKQAWWLKQQEGFEKAAEEIYAAMLPPSGREAQKQMAAKAQ